MVTLTKRRVSEYAAKVGNWFENPEGFTGLAVKVTGLDTDECVKVRQSILENMFGESDVDVAKYQGLQEYINARVLLDAAVKDIRGLTNDAGKAIDYTRDYLAGILLRDQAGDAKNKTPDGKEYDPGAKQIYNMLIILGSRANRVKVGEEKKEPPASFAGAGASPSANTTGGKKEAGKPSPTDSAKDAAKN